MDDLDALLADLQNSKSFNSNNVLNVPISDNFNNSISYDSPSSHSKNPSINMSKNFGYKKQQMPLPNESFQEHDCRRTPQNNINQKSLPQHTSTLSSNLSELDNLLQELSSAQFNVEVDRRSSGNLSNSSTSYTNSMNCDGIQNKSSLATNELDELMASLSVMNASDEPFYSTPMKDNKQQLRDPPQGGSIRNISNIADTNSIYSNATYNNNDFNTSHHNNNNNNNNSLMYGSNYDSNSIYCSERQPAVEDVADGGQLNSMMEDLNKNMSMQGIQTAPRGHCAACSKIIVGQVITALGQLWHPEHFVCAHCKEEIGTKNFFERDALPYCEEDYHYLFSPRCAQCNEPILNKCVTALDQTWHPEHFTCHSCGRQLGDEGFHEKDGFVFCQSDYFNHFAPKCGACGDPIVENFITALDQQWHPKCFACFECKKPFGASSFFEYEGLPYCETHFHSKRGSLCATCNQPITGRCITAMFRKFHPDHFVCTYCQKTLNKGTFKEENEKPYCHQCFNKLFG